MSVNPLFAALTGLIVLSQPQHLAGWLAITAIVTANAVSVSTGGRHRPGPGPCRSGPGPVSDPLAAHQNGGGPAPY